MTYYDWEREFDRPPKTTGRVALGCSVLALGAVAAVLLLWGAWRLAVHLWG